MPDTSELQRENSSSRIIYEALGRLGPQTQSQLSAHVDVTVSCASKCLKLLVEEGYVRREGRTVNRKGVSIGKQPWLYARTVKPLPEIRPDVLPDPPSAQELRDIMNSIIRRKNS
jgi:DNA-binding Lrp family transcriptional regulator